jgi:hypothetical protein
MTDRAANLDAARAYLQEARRRRHAPASRAFYWTLLRWAANARQRASQHRAEPGSAPVRATPGGRPPRQLPLWGAP